MGICHLIIIPSPPRPPFSSLLLFLISPPPQPLSSSFAFQVWPRKYFSTILQEKNLDKRNAYLTPKEESMPTSGPQISTFSAVTSHNRDWVLTKWKICVQLLTGQVAFSKYFIPWGLSVLVYKGGSKALWKIPWNNTANALWGKCHAISTSVRPSSLFLSHLSSEPSSEDGDSQLVLS